jgi:tetratricopeptide (TPR) repeat protein
MVRTIWKPLAASVLAASLLFGASPEFERARRLYDSTEFEQSAKVLQAIAAKDAAVLALLGQNYFMLADYKKATDCLEKAVEAAPTNPGYVLWLGRAFGRRAEVSSVLTAPGYASKAHRYFEKAVELDPKNLDALNDLFDYYLEAPGFLGGGIDKAQGLAARMAAINPTDGYGAEAKLAEKRKEYGTAEMQLRRAVAAAPRQIGKLIELAHLLTKQGRYQDADKAIDAAEQIAPDNPRLMFAKADLYIKSNRHLDVARQLLHKYMSSSLTPDDPPRSQAEKLLRQAGS